MITTVDAVDGDRRERVVDAAQTMTVGELAAAFDRPTADPPAADTPDAAGRPGAPDRAPTGGGRSVGGPVGRPLFLGGRRLDPATTVGDSGIWAGALIGVGGPVEPVDQVRRAVPHPDEPVLAEVHLVSGPGAGSTWQLAAGSHEIGHDERCAVRIPDPDGPAGGLWVTVTVHGGAYWHLTADIDEQVRAASVVAPAQASPLTGRPIGEPDPGEDDPDDPDEAHLPVASTTADVDVADVPSGATAWPCGEDLVVGSVLLRLTAPVEPDAAVVPSADGFGLDYNRPPRIAPHLDTDRVRLPTPPGPQPPPRFPLLLVAAPAVMGLGMVWLFQSYLYFMFVVLSPVMGVANWIGGRRTNRREAVKSRRRYGARLRRTYRAIHRAVRHERRVRNHTVPDPATVALIATGPGSRLWERRRRDPDHLVLRIGTVDQPSAKAVDDPARDDGGEVRWNVPDVGIAVDVAESGVIGVAGTAAATRELARWWLLQAAVLHSPRDLRVVVLTEPDRADGFAWVRWLPHAAPIGANGPLVAVGTDPESVANRLAELVSQIENRERALGSSMSRAMFTDPDLLVIVDGARRMRDVPGLVQVLTAGPQVRVFSVCLDERERLLPEECTAVVAADADGFVLRRGGVPDLADIRPDRVTVQLCEQVARSVAPLRDVSPHSDSGLPEQARLLDLLTLEPPTAAAVVQRWRRRPASTAVPIGLGYDGPLVLDLVRDGPHGLVAGTTGSGKSELLQSLVAGLAATNRPDEMAFVLVDYKGGSAFRQCAMLPHTLGMVTDLDAHLAQRALQSLAAELRRREHLLAEAAVKDHSAYRARRATGTELPPLPRLLLVIDEFATLIREMPEFVTGMISIAQRGRSLGIHLVLATQRPAGVVTADIRANTNLRIALRVTNSGESQDVIETSEAGLISPTTPGRALVRTGAGQPVPFQAAYLGAERPGARPTGAAKHRRPVSVAEVPVQRLGRPITTPVPEGVEPDPPEPVPTDLDALVDAIVRAADLLEDCPPQPSPWLPPLPDHVVVDDLPAVSREQPVPAAPPPVPYALQDLPSMQRRQVAVIDFTTFGHLYVVGAPRSGRTQVLRTIAGSVARAVHPSDVHVYGLDAGGGGLVAVEALPHCGAVVSRHDMERVERLLRRLGQELSRRQELCAEHHCAGLTELRGLLPAARRPAHLLVLVDGWDALVPLLEEHDHGRLLEDMSRLLREGAGVGIHLVMTSERSLLGGRLAAFNDHKLLLRQSDRAEYQAVGFLPSRAPTHVPPGRGWEAVHQVETQVALLTADPAGKLQAEALRRIGAEARSGVGAPVGPRPFPIAALPARIEFADVLGRVPDEDRRPLRALLGVGNDDAGPVTVDLIGATSTFVIAGPTGSGRSNALASLAVSLLAGGTALVVLTPRESPLHALGRHPAVRLLADADPSAESVQSALDSLTGPRVVLVDDADLLASTAADRVLREVAATGRDHGMALVCAGAVDSLSMAMGSWLSAVKRSRRGLVFQPRTPAEADLVGLRLPMNLLRGVSPVGRAWTAGAHGTAVAVQVPLTALRGD
ncbi:FtsK/SpoIIIE domain-containing protein [Solwaraspora sp. WMMD792]|uniref:FtsK/SpoIIIE domain-containing protein n=1 Tax=Solwaraspora sp. WMMD792 TaxID=3016099 RepID=UPI002416AE04|nr:FtsK/SpoIIIE domain-containing protein [Solwaraspora sp. WMMD792]MDG4772847.1 FtsK/SpoIIIE domain-containing protein [Solwaraspora sp. WMMD792]